MTRAHYVLCVFCFLAGIGWGLFAGQFIDRDRETVIVEVMQFIDKRWDVQSENTVIARPDPAGKEGP